MPVVTFLPAGRSTTVAEGVSLLDAATQAGVTLAAPCGGEGACGECRAQVESGSVERVPRGYLSADEVSDGWVLACSSRISGDVTVRIADPDDIAPSNIVTEGAGRRSAEGPPDRASGPAGAKYLLAMTPPATGESLCDFARLARDLRSQAGVDVAAPSLHVLRDLAAALRAKEGRVTVTVDVGTDAQLGEIVRVEPGDTTGMQVGLAIDVGTTTCAVSLVDLARGHILGTEADYNGQLARGADIISRISYAKTAERTEELRGLVLSTVNGLIDRLCAKHDVDSAQIDNAVVAGNTTMVHLLLGLHPEYIRLEPYTPTVNRPPRLRGREVGLAMNPEAYVLFAPGAGSYVGGDITAGLLQTALADDSEDIRLFLDIGTNGEVVVGNGEWLMACAASAGPAFEGSGVGCGTRAGTGAIERIRIDPETGEAHVSVIGGGRPRGACGSGMIDLLAELWAAGVLDQSGKLDPSRGDGRIGPAPGGGRHLAYTVVPQSQTDTGEPISIDERDIQNLLRTKAAVYSACAIMLKSLGLDFDAVEEVYVAGGFGRFLDLEKSITIGLLPDLPLERFTYLGNSALSGALAMLCSSSARENVVRIADRMTYLELNADPAYMSEYTAALFLPHTDIDRFPSVKAALASRQGS